MHPHLFEEIEGIAEAADVPVEDLLALNGFLNYTIIIPMRLWYRVAHHSWFRETHRAKAH